MKRLPGEIHGVLCAGVVREWDDEGGFGVIDSDDTPGGCWAHFSSVIVPEGLAELTPGENVSFTCEPAEQDGYRYRAIHVWPPGVEPGTASPVAPAGTSPAYQSTLTIRFADGRTTISQSGDEPLPFIKRAMRQAEERDEP